MIRTVGLSTDIRLPKNVKPIFPKVCVYSGEENPDSEIVIPANSQNPILAFLAPILLVFGWKTYRAPICRGYKARFYFFHYGREVVMIILVVIALWKVMPLFDRHDGFRKFKVAGVMLIAVSPWIFFEIFVPRKFNVTAGSNWVDYEFASNEYAGEFALLNAPNVMQVL
jgi:hypothetical protein